MTAPGGDFMQPADLSKKMMRTICVLAPALMAASALYYRSAACLPFIWGVLLGSAVGVAKVLLLKRAVDRALCMKETAAAGYVSLQHLLRLLLTGGALVLAAVVPGISLWGAVAGVVTYQLAVYLIRFTAKS